MDSEALAFNLQVPPVPMRRRSFMKRRPSPKRVWTFFCGLAAFLSFARVASLFLESYTTVRSERSSDHRLLDLCKSDNAPTESAHMRAACLKAQRDQASPLIFKASLRAVNTAWEEFSETIGSPFKLAVVVLFLLSGLVMPLMPAVRAASEAASMMASEIEDDDEETQVIVVNGGFPRLTQNSVRSRVKRLLRGADVEEVGEDVA